MTIQALPSNLYYKKIIYIKLASEEFLKYNPPCKECLIQNMCITDFNIRDNGILLYHLIKIEYCHLLKKFINDDTHFTYNLSMRMKNEKTENDI